ncbi:MAG: MBL fold metallo-hydrolase [Thermoplasmatota archaeon]
MKITYITHSCFIIESKNVVLLFDYPSGSFINEEIREIVVEIIKDSELYTFISHSHSDHYNTEIFEFDRYAEKIIYILADEIPLSSELGSENIHILGPDEKLDLDDLQIITFKSNDEGVAFLIEAFGTKIYFGGDLAKWDWPEWTEEKRRSKVNLFKDVLDELKDLDIDIAFSNMDERLESWAGPVDFIETVRPDHFIPIHTFGNEEWIDDLLKVDLPGDVKIFKYENTGDSLEIK